MKTLEQIKTDIADHIKESLKFDGQDDEHGNTYKHNDTVLTQDLFNAFYFVVFEVNEFNDIYCEVRENLNKY